MTPKGHEKKNFVMVRIPAGEFIMGSRPGQGEPDEFPPHRVWVDGFLMGQTPVTALEWAGFLNDQGHQGLFEPSEDTTVVWHRGRFHPRLGCTRHPANGVTWHGASAFCQWLTRKTGKYYRLPYEAEWEKAARGGLVDKRFPWGNDSAQGRAHFQQVSTEPRFTLAPVGSYPPNSFGLFDMAGNVWEWCSDWYDRNYYHSSPEKNPTGPLSGTLKVLRGGSWGGLDVQVRCGIRVGEFLDVSEPRVGFRVVRALEEDR